MSAGHPSSGDAQAAGEQRGPQVVEFRQIVLWPVQLAPYAHGVQVQRHWELLDQASETHPWKELDDEQAPRAAAFSEREYKEFVTFLPYVQRFLYGQRHGDEPSVRPMRVFRRTDVTQARVWFPEIPDPVVLQVARVDLHFFYDIDVAILAVEFVGRDVTLTCAMESMYRMGRAYPTHWDPVGHGGHCVERVELLSPSGETLAVSDYGDRDAYLDHVGKYRAARPASHWAYLLAPLVLDQSAQPGNLRYREVEYQRMPVMTYLAVDDKSQLDPSDFVKLGLVTRPGARGSLPYSKKFLQNFEAKYCYDRYWEDEACGHDWPDTRFMCSGHAFTVIVDAKDAFCVDRQSGVLGQFRHQYFLLAIIAHFQKAALLMLRDRLVNAMTRLEIRDVETVRRFKRSIRHSKEIFLRFTHRYWFHEISDQALTRDLYRLWVRQLGTVSLYEDVRKEILDMTEYLDSDQVRRQADTVVRLTVVTVLGLIVNIVTGWFGMNLIAAADRPVAEKAAYFLLVLTPTVGLVLYTVSKSKRLANFLEAMSDDQLSNAQKYVSFKSVWRDVRAKRPSGR